MKLTESEVTIEDGSRLVVTLSMWQVASFAILAAGVVGSVWLATRDLGFEVARLSASINALVAQRATDREDLDEHDRRIWKLENGASAPRGGAP